MKLRFFDEEGAALVEVSLVASLVILPLMLGAFELGRVAHYAIETENAARAATSYGSANPGNAGTIGTVTQAAQNDAPDLTSISAAPTTACVCETVTLSGGNVTYNPSSGTVSCTSATITSCNTVTSTSVQYIVSYTSVPTTVSVAPLFKVKGLPLTYSLNGYSALRVLPN